MAGLPQGRQRVLATAMWRIKIFADLAAATIPRHFRGSPIELWWQDESSIRHPKALRALKSLVHSARVGLQGTLTHIWAKRCSRATAATVAYIFGAVCPARGTSAALVLPTKLLKP